MIRKKKEYSLIQLILDLKKVSNINLFGIKQDKQPTIKKPTIKKEIIKKETIKKPISKKEKLKEFYRKHKKKIIGAGTVLTAAATYAVINKHHKNKVKQEQEKNKIEQDARAVEKRAAEKFIGAFNVKKERTKFLKYMEKRKENIEELKKLELLTNRTKEQEEKIILLKSEIAHDNYTEYFKLCDQYFPEYKDIKNMTEDQRRNFILYKIRNITPDNFVRMGSFYNRCSNRFNFKKDIKTTEDSYKKLLYALIYTDYSEQSLRKQFMVIYFSCLDIIFDYYDDKTKFKTGYQERFLIFLNKKIINKNDKICIIKHNKLLINYAWSPEVEVVTNETTKNLIYSEINTCYKNNNNNNIVLNIILEGKKGNSHANMLFIDVLKKKMWRLEPNYLPIIDIFNPSEISINLALHKFFIKYPLSINNEIIKFESISNFNKINSCPFHGGLCMFVSSLQSVTNGDVTMDEIRKNVIEYFIWEYKNIYKEKFNIDDINNVKISDLFNVVNNIDEKLKDELKDGFKFEKPDDFFIQSIKERVNKSNL
jgi:hypothetical protein